MKLSDQDRAKLQAARSDKYDGSVSARAQIVLWHSEGRPTKEIASASKKTWPTVDKWIARYREYGRRV